MREYNVDGSSVGRAAGCDPVGRGKSRPSPQSSWLKLVEARIRYLVSGKIEEGVRIMCYSSPNLNRGTGHQLGTYRV